MIREVESDSTHESTGEAGIESYDQISSCHSPRLGQERRSRLKGTWKMLIFVANIQMLKFPGQLDI